MLKQLFSIDIPVIPENEPQAQAQLDALKAAFPRLDEYFIVSGAVEERRARFENLWKIYEPYSDRDFVEQAQKRFHQKTWEMYLGNVLLRNGYSMEPVQTGKPDLKVVRKDEPTIWIECVAPEKGNGTDRVPEMVHGIVQTVPEEEILLRIAATFEEKSKKFSEYLKKHVIADNEPRVIAINIGDLDHVDGSPPRIISVLFAIGHLTLQFDQGRKNVTNTFYQRRTEISKKSGAKVQLGQFLGNEHKHVSAVIYSKNTVLNHPAHIGSDCILVHNPNTTVPLAEGVFPFMTSFVGGSDTVHRINPTSEAVIM